MSQIPSRKQISVSTLKKGLLFSSIVDFFYVSLPSSLPPSVILYAQLRPKFFALTVLNKVILFFDVSLEVMLRLCLK